MLRETPRQVQTDPRVYWGEKNPNLLGQQDVLLSSCAPPPFPPAPPLPQAGETLRNRGDEAGLSFPVQGGGAAGQSAQLSELLQKRWRRVRNPILPQAG